MSLSSVLVKLHQVSFAYDDSVVLRDVSLQVNRGQLVAIMGGSGSGKTTLLRLMSGQLSANTGQIWVGEKDISNASEHDLYVMRKKLGMLFQLGALFTDLSVYDNVAFPLRERTRLPESMIRDLVLMKLEAVGLRGVASRFPAELSGGMARRVALARAIALDPSLMLYDEPFTGLDPISLSTIGQLIRELNDALNIASVIVTHDVSSALLLADYIYFLAEGKIVAQGTPAEVRHDPHPFVHQFIHGETEGPVPFHKPAGLYEVDLGLRGAYD